MSVMVFNCLHGQAPQYLTNVCQPASSVVSRQSASQRLMEVPRYRRGTIALMGFRCVWSVGVERAVRLPEGSGSQQGHIQEALKDVFIHTLLTHAAH